MVTKIYNYRHGLDSSTLSKYDNKDI